MERRLHGWSRAKKQALVEGRFDVVTALAKRRTTVNQPVFQVAWGR